MEKPITEPEPTYMRSLQEHPFTPAELIAYKEASDSRIQHLQRKRITVRQSRASIPVKLLRIQEYLEAAVYGEEHNHRNNHFFDKGFAQQALSYLKKVQPALSTLSQDDIENSLQLLLDALQGTDNWDDFVDNVSMAYGDMLEDIPKEIRRPLKAIDKLLYEA